MNKVYLGDSVYASFDGYHIWIETNNGYPDDPRNRIAIELPVYRALVAYAKQQEVGFHESTH